MNIHHRRSIRLRYYNYSRLGSYFVTICTHNHECLFGNVIDGEMVLNNVGRIVCEEWLKSVCIRKEIDLDNWVIMPNHIHGIVVISTVGANGGSPKYDHNPNAEANGVSPKTINNTIRAHGHAPLQGSQFSLKPHSIGSFIAGFKSITTKRVNQILNIRRQSIWQRNYYERIIRDERELNKIRRYVINNPAKWTYDIENQNGLPINDKQKFWSKFLNEFDD